jgi:hypothetical protein
LHLTNIDCRLQRGTLGVSAVAFSVLEPIASLAPISGCFHAIGRFSWCRLAVAIASSYRFVQVLPAAKTNLRCVLSQGGAQEEGPAAEPVLESIAGDNAAPLRACNSFLLENSDFMLTRPILIL